MKRFLKTVFRYRISFGLFYPWHTKYATPVKNHIIFLKKTIFTEELYFEDSLIKSACHMMRRNWKKSRKDDFLIKKWMLINKK